MSVLGLSLTGGGARGAYQAGVTHGLCEIAMSAGLQDGPPIKAFSGLSAGAINATYMAASKDNIMDSSKQLCTLWENLTPQEVYKTDFLSMSKIGLGWIKDVTMGSFFNKKTSSELLNSEPLNQLIDNNIDFAQIEKNIKSKKIIGVSCNAYNYSLKKSVSFIQCNSTVSPWNRPKRYSENTDLTTDHVAASCAIPLIFSPVKVENTFYGDGSLRNTAPISPIIHLGAEKIIMIGVRNRPELTMPNLNSSKPSVAEIFGTMLNGLFFDTTDIDIDRLNSNNNIIDRCTNEEDYHGMKKISYINIRPSKDLAKIAESLSTKHLPDIVSYLLRGLGDKKESAELSSYLLFDSSYTKKLVEIGYEDAYKMKSEIINLLGYDSQ